MKKIIVLLILVISITGLVFSDEIDEVRELLRGETGGEIRYLSKINLGFPGGDNWIADRRDGYTYIYTVKSDKEVKIVHYFGCVELSRIKYFDPDTLAYVDLEYDIMQDIPGTRIGNKAAKFGDYNGDGRDDIIIVYLGTDGLNCEMWGYNVEKGAADFYFFGRCNISSVREPTPIGFFNYKGINGIKTHVLSLSGDLYFWTFSAWDENRRKYVELASLGQSERDYSLFTLSQTPDSLDIQESDVVVTVIDQQEETTINEADSNSGGRFNFGTVIIGIAVLAGITFISTRKKKDS